MKTLHQQFKFGFLKKLYKNNVFIHNIIVKYKNYYLRRVKYNKALHHIKAKI